MKGLAVWLAIVVATLGASPEPASAEVRTPAKARYQTQDGWSTWKETDVTFMTGSELNTATSTYKYSPYTGYAVIFFAEGQAAVIKASGYSYCSDTFEVSCLPSIGNFKGVDQGGRDWEICTGSFC